MFISTSVFWWTSLALVHVAHSNSIFDVPSKVNHASHLVARQNNGDPTCLDPNVIQTASALTGQEDGTDGIKEGQAPSEVYVSFTIRCDLWHIKN
jgi:hypothetical protein